MDEMILMDLRIDNLENKMARMEKLIWYTAGILTLKIGGEGLSFVSALGFG